MSRIAEASAAYRITCRCGRTLQGQRQRDFQRLSCPQCGHVQLIFPDIGLGQLLLPQTPQANPRPTASTLPRIRGWWRQWLLLVLAGILLGGLGWGLRFLMSPLTPQIAQMAQSGPSLAQLRKQIQQALSRRDLRLAGQRLGQLADQLHRDPSLLSGLERWKVLQQQKEIALANDLLYESLPELLQTGVEVAPEVWEWRFDQRYRGRSVIFDAQIGRNPMGEYQFDYLLRVNDQDCIIDWERLRLFDALPFGEPRRLIFGFRLETAYVDAFGRWHIEPRSDSGVLITLPELLEDGLVAVDEELHSILQMQDRWLQEIPEKPGS